MNIAENILKHSLQNVYFLTGTACAGKTTMARELSKKYGFVHFNDNWNEENYKIWESIISEKYQPKTYERMKLDNEQYFSRSVEECLQDNKILEYIQFSIIELIKLSVSKVVIADIWAPMDLIFEISDYNRVACLLAPGTLIVRDYYDRDDHKDYTNAIKSLKDPQKAFAIQNELFIRGAKEFEEEAKRLKLFTIMRTDESTVHGHLKLLEEHFGFL